MPIGLSDLSAPSYMAAVIVAIVIVMAGFAFIGTVFLWAKARKFGVRIGLFKLLALRFRKGNPRVIVDCLIIAHRAGIAIPASRLEEHLMIGGDVYSVVTAMAAAKEQGVDLSFDRASAIDITRT